MSQDRSQSVDPISWTALGDGEEKEDFVPFPFLIASPRLLIGDGSHIAFAATLRVMDALTLHGFEDEKREKKAFLRCGHYASFTHLDSFQ